MSTRTNETIASALRRLGAATRAELVAETGLSRATVTAGISELLEAGVVTAAADGEGGGRGRRASKLALVPPRGVICAIDLGHAHRSVVIADSRGTILVHDSRQEPVDRDPRSALDEALETARTLVESCAEHGELLSVGVIVPQPVSNGEIVRSPFISSWNGIPVSETVRRVFDVPIAVENDANAGALAEHDGTMSSLIFVKVSTGIGAGVIIGNQLVRGSFGQAGEIGHLALRQEGQLCGCGNRGCLETLASVPAILRSLEPIHGRLDRQGLERLLAQRDIASERAMHDAGEAIGTALAPVIAALQPGRLMIGGLEDIPVGSIVEGANARIRKLVHREILGDFTVGPSNHGAMSPVQGALTVAMRAGAIPTRAGVQR